MAGRVTLLILMTGLFASAWSFDGAPEATTKPVSNARKEASPPAVRETMLHRWQHASPATTASTNRAWTPTRDADMASHIPEHIPAGTYLVVHADGRADRVEIAATQATQTRSAGDHYVIQSYGQRQHWIRVAESSAPTVGHESVVVVLLDRDSLAEMSSSRRADSTVVNSMRPSLQQLVQALSAMKKGSLAAEDAESINR